MFCPKPSALGIMRLQHERSAGLQVTQGAFYRNISLQDNMHVIGPHVDPE